MKQLIDYDICIANTEWKIKELEKELERYKIYLTRLKQRKEKLEATK